MTNNRVVFVLGGSRGMGRHIVLAFAKNGYDVAFSYNTDQIRANEVENEAKSYGSDCISLKVNCVNESELITSRIEIMEKYGRIDVLINNAGIFENGLIKEMNLNSWKDVIDVNLTGIFLCIKTFIEVMENQNYGRIINIGSVVGDTGVIGAGNYAASKAGLIGLTKTVALEVSQKGITANVVSLGYMNEGMGNRLSEKTAKKVLDKIPLKAFGNAEKVALMIMHLASEEAEYITGQVININGGINM